MKSERTGVNTRACERMPANVRVRFFCGTVVSPGKVVNCSENGMCINTRSDFFPCNYSIELIIPLSQGVYKINATIRRVVKKNYLNYDMGVEVLNPPKAYLEFVAGLRNAHQ